jgi:hypothetical protein
VHPVQAKVSLLPCDFLACNLQAGGLCTVWRHKALCWLFQTAVLYVEKGKSWCRCSNWCSSLATACGQVQSKLVSSTCTLYRLLPITLQGSALPRSVAAVCDTQCLEYF